MAPLLNKYYWKESFFDGAKPTLKILLASWAFYITLKGFWTFNAKNLGSVDQRAAKLPEPGISGLEKTAPSGKLEFASRSY